MSDDLTLFPKSTKRSVTLLGVALVAVLVGSIACANGAFAEIVEAPPAKVVVPLAAKAVSVPEVVVAPISVESFVQPPVVVTKTTLVVTHPDRDDVDDPASLFDPGQANVNFIIELFEKNQSGCTVIIGEAETIRQKTFFYTIGKTKCTIVQVVKTIEEVMPLDPPLLGGGQ
jgi:hypothetical protein